MKEKLNIYQKLHKIQCTLLGLAKDKQANSYSYVTGDKVLEHVKPFMNELGLILKQEIISIDNDRQDYRVGINQSNLEGRPKSEILSKVMMKFTWVDIETGEKDENLFGANGQNDWDKGVGSALTYGERYFLLKFFHIATDEDDIDNPDRKKKELLELPLLSQTKADYHINLKTPLNELKKLFTLTQEQEEKYINSIRK
jgi:hypothetical protein